MVTERLAGIITALLVLIFGMMLASIVKKRLTHHVRRAQDPTVNSFLVNCIYVSMVAIIIITTLTLLGVPTTALITVLGAASLAIGLAMKEFLSNVAAGFLLIFLRPFRVGDTITVLNNITGKVIEINLFVTQIDTVTNEAIFVPNSQLANAAIINKTRYPLRQIDLRITVASDTDVEKAKKILTSVATQHPAIHSAPAPFSAVAELSENGVVLLLRAWVDSSDAKINFELYELIKNVLQQEKISLPTPQMEVVLRRETVNESS